MQLTDILRPLLNSVPTLKIAEGRSCVGELCTLWMERRSLASAADALVSPAVEPGANPGEGHSGVRVEMLGLLQRLERQCEGQGHLLESVKARVFG